jgi:PAS domain-containing protein
METNYYKRIFEAGPALYLILSPSFEILDASNAYLSATLTKREHIIGKHIFTIFPDNPDDSSATGTTNLRASLERVLQSKIQDTMAIQKYDVTRPDGKGFDVKYWSCFNIPILSDTGEVDFIIHRAEEVTDFILQQEQGVAQEKKLELELYKRAQELQVTNQKLRSTEQLKSELAAILSAVKAAK